MKPITLEWIEKAEGDWATLTREHRARTNPNYDAVCFHAQQCAEKYLKARFQEAEIAFAKTHDLEKLLDDLLFLEPDWNGFRNEAIALTAFAVEFRYPGMKAIKSDAGSAVKYCRLIRKIRSSVSEFAAKLDE